MNQHTFTVDNTVKESNVAELLKEFNHQILEGYAALELPVPDYEISITFNDGSLTYQIPTKE